MTTNRMGLTPERLEQYANDKRMCNVNDEIRAMANELLKRRNADGLVECECETCSGTGKLMSAWVVIRFLIQPPNALIAMVVAHIT